MQWLFCKNIARNEFLTSNYPEIKVLHINIALEDQILDSDPLLIYIMCSFCSLKKNAQSCRSGNQAKFTHLPT